MLTTGEPSPDTDGPLLKLIDFGLACDVNDAKGLFDSLHFVPPEHAGATLRRENAIQIDLDCKSTDVYALGVTYYYLLSSMYPYTHSSAEILFQEIEAQSYKIPESVRTNYPLMVPLLKSMLSTRENRCSVDEVLNFIEILAIHEYSGDIQQYDSSSSNQGPGGPSLTDKKRGTRSKMRGTRKELGCSGCFEWKWRRKSKKVR